MGEIMPEDILEFASSSRYEPVLGFNSSQLSTYNPHPQWLPTASICANQLYLPVTADDVTPFPFKEKLMALIDKGL